MLEALYLCTLVSQNSLNLFVVTVSKVCFPHAVLSEIFTAWGQIPFPFPPPVGPEKREES